MTAPRTIAIIGAGLGGLTAALALLRAGWRVRVYEQAPVLGEVGAGLSVSAGTGRALASLGIGPALLAASLPVPAVAFAHYRTGKLLAGVFDDGAPPDHGFATARHIHRADLHAILLAAVRAIDAEAVLTGCRLIDAWQDDGAAHARFADGRVITADLLIGADGARSAVRRSLFDPDAPEFAGQVAFRCLVPRALAAPFMGRGNAVVSVGAGRMFHRYLIRGGALVNVIGIGRSDGWREEGWNIPATNAEFLSDYADFHPDVTGLIAAAPAAGLIKWGLFVRPPIARWHRGRVVLLGDAAHPILPFLGLGAALAIEDGIVLARALSAIPDPGAAVPDSSAVLPDPGAVLPDPGAVLPDPGAFLPDLAAALAAYHAARVARVETVRVETIRQGEIIQSADPDRGNMGTSPSQDRTLFDYDPTTAPIAPRIAG